jgi:hypothetical protein
MNWDSSTKTLEISYQDLEHILDGFPDEDFEEGLDSELFLAGLRDAEGRGLQVAEIETILIHFQQRTGWAQGTPPEMLAIHRGKVKE